jgi:hypothetical protein
MADHCLGRSLVAGPRVKVCSELSASTYTVTDELPITIRKSFDRSQNVAIWNVEVISLRICFRLDC